MATRNASDAKEIARAKQRQLDADNNRRIVLERLLSDSLGRKFLWDLIAGCNVFRQTVDTGPNGHAVMCFKEGQKSFGLELFNQIVTKWPQAYGLMTRENSGVDIDEEKQDD